MHRSSLLLALSLALALPPIVRPAAAQQLEPPSTGGAVALDHELRMLGHHKRVLMIGAHPDDEDTELLTILSRRDGAEAAYLALNRGEGGQNLIGPELGEALGLIRTEELLAARRIDGARQFFTRAYDFGFSKTLDDTWAHWPRDSVLKDVVRVIRRFRPQVIVSVFSGTPRDGHGQHQAAGWAAQEAFRIAGDSTRFPELEREEGLAPFTPLKLYRSTRFDTSATTLALEGGELDAAVGQSFHQLAMRSRSQHRSQDMGRLQDVGPSPVRVMLWADRTGKGAGAFWAGVDTSALSLAARPDQGWAPARAAAQYAALADSARTLAGPAERTRLVALLERLAARADAMVPSARGGRPLATDEQSEQRAHLARAATIARGLVFDAYTDDARVAPGQAVEVTLTAWNTGAQAVRVAFLPRSPGAGWRIRSLDGDAEWVEVPAGALAARRYAYTAPAEAAATVPYFLRRPLAGSMYQWPAEETAEDAAGGSAGLPFEPSRFVAAFRVRGPDGASTTELDAEREIAFRTNDQAYGEVRRPVLVVPRVDVKMDPDTALWAAGGRDAHRFTVTLTHGTRDTTTGRVRLELPAGWPAVAPQSFVLTREDEVRDFAFDVTPPANAAPGSYSVRAVAEAEGRRYEMGLFTVDYPHIRPRTFTSPAAAHVVVAPLALPKVARVGYIRGAADRVPEALRQAGLPVELIDARTLEHGDLSRYDVIVVGPRAYETSEALVANNDRLLDYARRGGRVVVQYQQYQFVRGGYAPLPLTMATPHDRVTDETAAVTALDPASPVLAGPNRIGPDDWRGWVQERGLYFAHEWDGGYHPVLSMHDPGEAPLQGALLVAPLGRGSYVYTGLSFFRELPAGVPGAFRLFLNLLALAPAPAS